LIYLNKQFW